MLYLVSTPIGNMRDITYRAIDILKSVELILAEDTRRTGLLLKEYGVSARMESFNDVNKDRKIGDILEMLSVGKDFALVSDSGTPGISDPGFVLCREAVKRGIAVTSIPGPCAAISALVSSGLETDLFSFIGFLPKKEGRKRSLFESIKERKETIIAYESPYRLAKTIGAMAEVFPEKRVVVARELTKKFEEIIRGTAKEVHGKIKSRKIKGEIVLLIGKDDKDSLRRKSEE